MQISKEDQIKNIAPFLKEAGFKKKASNWRRSTSDGVHVVNIQGSQWGSEYYLNLGFYLSALGEEESPTEYRCHVRTRIDPPDIDAQSLVREILQWFSSNGNIASLLERQANGTLPIVTTGKTIEFLQQHNKAKH